MSFAFAPHRHLLGVYLRPLRGRASLLGALIAGDIALRLVNPQIIRSFIDTAQAGGPLRALMGAGALFILVGLLSRMLNLASTYFGLNIGWTATNRLRNDLAGHLLRLDMPFHKTHTPGELIERVDGDVTALSEFFAELLVKVAGNALLVVAILVLLYRESATAGAILTVYVLVVVIVLAIVGRTGVRAWTAARQAWAEQMGFLEERFAGAEDLRGIGAEAHAQARLGRLMLNLLRRARGGWMANALASAITNLLFVVGYGLGLAIGAGLYLRGEATIGTAFLVLYYIRALSTPLEEIRDQAEQLQEATAGIGRVHELLRLTPQVQDTGNRELEEGNPEVVLERVSFRYDDLGTQSAGNGGVSELVLREIDFRLAPGRVLGVLGRTGSGKTTMTRLLFRLYDVEAGAIRLNGMDIREIPLAQLRKRVALVTQDVQLFGATVRENITLFDDSIAESEVRRALADLGLLEWVKAMPQGLETRLASGGGSISAGEAQLLAFARILLRDPGLVVLDEAASRLDPVAERRLERAIDRLLSDGADRRTAIVIAHRLRTVQRADDILILEDGRVMEFGPRAELAANPHSRFAGLLQTGLEEVLA